MLRVEHMLLITMTLLICSCNSVVKKYHPDGHLQVTYQTKNGKVQGLKKEYYPNGKLKSISYFMDDKLNGEYTSFYQSGNTFENGFYVKSKLIGDYKIFSDSGYLKEFRVYLNDTIQYISEFNQWGQMTREKRALFYTSDNDTISLGEVYSAKVRLAGPRPHYDFEVFAGFSNNDSVNSLEAVKMEGNHFAINFLPDKIGKHKVIGIARPDSSYTYSDVYTFVHYFYVK